MAKKPAKKPTATTRAKATSQPRTASTKSGFSKFIEGRDFRSLSVGAILAELLGTFALVLVYMTVQGSQLYLFFVYAALVLVFARISGPHLNPAITVGLWAARRITGLRAISYVIAQILGAMLALIVASALVPEAVNQLTGQAEAGQVFKAQDLPEETADRWRILTVEALGMLIFAIGAASAFMSRRGLAAKALTLGGAYMIGLLMLQGGQILNPAIALAVQAIKPEVWPIAIYILTPLAASIVGMSLYRFMQREADSKDENDNDTASDEDVVVTRVKV